YINTTIIHRDSISTKPGYLTGYYKYNGEELNGQMSHGTGKIVMLDNAGDTLVKETRYFDTSSVFKPFELELNYLNNNTPDSLIITFKNADQPCSVTGIMQCNLLYLDK